jgi:hypothetical protein
MQDDGRDCSDFEGGTFVMIGSRQQTGFLAVALAIGMLLVHPSYGQSQAINGSIRGRITDQANTPVAQASVKVENTQTGFSRSAETAEDATMFSRTFRWALIRSRCRKRI